MFAITQKSYRNLIFVNIGLYIFLFVVSNCFASSGEFQINCPYWYFAIDRAGYVDITVWYDSPRHSPYAHEMMTGDWASAVWYQGINQGSNQAQWLTDSFIIPSFGTGSPFDFNEYYVSNTLCNPVWTDPCQPNPPPYNPGTKSDSGWSTLDDGKLAVKIYYEVVDLDEQDANGVGGSPISFRDVNDNPVYVYSERYVLLQTYQFKNTSASDINNLEFYQMLHGHPTGSYPIFTKGMYETANFSDPLKNYVPCDSNHHTGDNFRYDITLWNPGDPETEHVDWMGFSSTVEPNVVDFNTFTGQGTGMEYNITHRALHGLTELADYELAGAMKWNLGNLEPNETKSITLTLMYGCGPVNYIPPTPVSLTKTDDISGCVSPDGLINYEIRYDANGHSDTNVVLTDYLPDEVDYNSSIPQGSYDSNTPRTVTWQKGTMGPSDTNYYHLQVKVNSNAGQGQIITNLCELIGDNFSKQATEDTNVCCYAPIVYVDINRPADGNGKSWQTAYKELRNALTNVRDGNCGCANQIWGHSMNISLVITEGYIDILINLFLYSECCIIKK